MNNRYIRSTNIFYDFDNPISTNDIIITNPIKELINNIHLASSIENASKAISIIGPYGTGKSTGLLFALKYFSGKLPLDQQKQLTQFHSNENKMGKINDNIIYPESFYIPCILIGKKKTLDEILFEELKKISNDLKLDINFKKISSIELVEKIVFSLSSQKQRLIIVIDELGKFLENAVENPTKGDIYVLQELAELAARQNGNLIIITSRHQSFESYASTLSIAEINEWKKIQGRFLDIIFQSNEKESLLFVKEALNDIPQKNIITSKSNKKFLEDLKHPLINNFDSFFYEKIKILHPFVSILITPLFKTIGQNERSVFSFLNSLENYSLQSFIKQNTSNQPFRLYNIFDYLKSNFSFSFSNSNMSNTWAQIEATLIKYNDLSDLELKIFKTISIIDMFKQVIHIDANIENLCFSILEDCDSSSQLNSSIENLLKKRVITINETWKTYHVFYSGNIDVESLINEKIINQFNFKELSNDLNTNIPLNPILAKKHYALTGTIRYFLQEYESEDFHLGEKFKEKNSNEPVIYHILYSEEKKINEIISNLELNKKNNSIPKEFICFFIKTSERLHKIYNYYKAIIQVKEENQNIHSDNVAKQNLYNRISKSENDIENELRKIYSKKNNNLMWTPMTGKKSIPDDYNFNRLLSKIFDEKFPNTPLIFNELSNKTKPSPTAVSIIKNLLKSILENESKPNLGLTGSAELGMYYSILKKTKIHKSKNENFVFSYPSDVSLEKLWIEFDEKFLVPSNEKFTINDLSQIMTDEPYGIKKGLHLILILSYLQLHKDKFSWYLYNNEYRDMRYIINKNKSTIDLFYKTPDDFYFSYVQSSEMNNSFYKLLIDKFDDFPKNNKTNFTTLDVLSPILRKLSILPDYTQKTSIALTDQTKKFRKVMFQATEPELLIEKDLPNVFDLPDLLQMSIGEKELFVKKFKLSYNELIQAYPELLKKIKNDFISNFKVKDIDEFIQKIKNLVNLEDKKLKPFISRAVSKINNENSWLESLASSVIPKPPRFWRDRDVKQFEIELEILADRFNLIEKIRLELNVNEKLTLRLKKIIAKIKNDKDYINLDNKEKEYLLSQLLNEIRINSEKE